MEENKVIERLKFYADTDKEKNKFFCFKINSIFDLEQRLMYWMKRTTYIRAAWYEVLEDGKVKENSRIDLDHFVNHKEALFTKNQS